MLQEEFTHVILASNYASQFSRVCSRGMTTWGTKPLTPISESATPLKPPGIPLMASRILTQYNIY